LVQGGSPAQWHGQRYVPAIVRFENDGHGYSLTDADSWAIKVGSLRHRSAAKPLVANSISRPAKLK
ncbi:MAG: hypothetical protein ACREXT_06685, partial [Gammaproteobacteria bacterium]